MNEKIKSISERIKQTALSLARHEDATEEINALLAMADCLEEIGAERNRPLTLEELKSMSGCFVDGKGEPVFVEYKNVHVQVNNSWGIVIGIQEKPDAAVWIATTFGTADYLKLRSDTCGIYWRPWRTRPTDSDRAAAKWGEA